MTTNTLSVEKVNFVRGSGYAVCVNGVPTTTTASTRTFAEKGMAVKQGVRTATGCDLVKVTATTDEGVQVTLVQSGPEYPAKQVSAGRWAAVGYDAVALVAAVEALSGLTLKTKVTSN